MTDTQIESPVTASTDVSTDIVHVDPPDSGVQVFSAPSDAPRVRRMTDLVFAGVATAILTLIAIVAGQGTDFDRSLTESVRELPGWLLWLAQAVYVSGVLYALLLLIGVGLFAHGRLELLRDMVLAAALAVAVSLGLTAVIDGAWPAFAILETDRTTTTFPAFFVTTATAIQAAAAPFLSRPMRRFGWVAIIAAAAASLLGSVTQLTDVAGAILVGLTAAAAIRLTFGTSTGMPSVARVERGLAELGLSLSDTGYDDVQPASFGMLTGTSDDGDTVLVRVLGRDAWSNRRWSRTWRRAWYVDEGSQQATTPREQVEHEALALLMAQGSGVHVPDLMAVGLSSLDDGYVAIRRSDDWLSYRDPDDVDDHLLDRIWSQVDGLHAAGVSHGRLDANHVWFDADGAPMLAGFTEASIAANDLLIQEDVAELIVATSLTVGADRAIAAARRSIGDARVTEALPAMQQATMNPLLRRELKGQKTKVDDLREQTAAALGVDTPEPQDLKRVSIGSIVSSVLIGFAVYTILSGLANVGWDTIGATLADARWGLVLVALAMTQLTNVTDAVSVSAASPKEVPVGVTTTEQFAISFVDIAVPSAAGKVATNVRFFQKFGLSGVTSTTVGVITGLVGFVAQGLLLFLTILVGKGSIDLSTLETGGSVLRLLGFAAVALVVGVIVIGVVPKWRHSAEQHIRTAWTQMHDVLLVLKRPQNASKVLGGAIGTEILFAAGLTLCVFAVGGSVSLGEALFINVVVSLFAGLVPVPGGVGVYEAGVSAGLTAVGVPSDIAISAVLVYRMCSYYLPPIWGWFCLRWLTKHEYL